jgi:hypothetical protein
MRVSTMKQMDCVRVADFIGRAIEALGQDEATPHLGYMTRPENTPDYAYRYYNVRSRHFRLQEVFFVCQGDDGEIDGVISFADIGDGKAYVRLLALGSSLMNGTNGDGVTRFVDESVRELTRFVKTSAVRVITAGQQESEERVGPHVSPAFLRAIERCGFQELARLDREGGHDVHVEIHESAVT